MSEEPTTVGTEPQEVLDSSVPHKDPAVVVEEEDDGEESDTYDDFDAEDNKDDGEDAGAEEYDPNEDGEDDEEYDEGEDEEAGAKKSNLTALLLDPNAGAYADGDEDGEDADGDEDDDDDADYAEDAEADEAEYAAETPAVHTNGNGKKRSIDDVNSEDGGLEADEREAAVKKVKA